MVKIKDYAKAYEPTKMKNIAELEVVNVDLEITDEVRKTREGEEYRVSFIVVEGEEYRIPISVIEQLKTILEARPELKTFKVSKKGEGNSTKYTVISLD